MKHGREKMGEWGERVCRIAWLVAGASAVVVAACAGSDDTDAEGETSAEDVRHSGELLCQLWADCEGLDSTFVDGCVADVNEQIAAAESYGCLDIMDAWFTCLTDNSTCTPEGEFADQDMCSDEEELAEDCRNGRL